MRSEGLRERKKRERRRCIEEVALELFEERGFDGTTIEEIARAADIAPRTFFTYFATKEDVALADYAGRLGRVVDELALLLPTERPWAALRSAFAVVATDYENERAMIARRFAIMGANPSVLARSLQLQTGWEASVVALVAPSDDPHDLDARLIGATAVAAMRSAIAQWMVTGHATPLPTLMDECFDRLGAGLDRQSATEVDGSREVER